MIRTNHIEIYGELRQIPNPYGYYSDVNFWVGDDGREPNNIADRYDDRGIYANGDVAEKVFPDEYHQRKQVFSASGCDGYRKVKYVTSRTKDDIARREELCRRWMERNKK